MTPSPLVLVADIGGTNTRVALADGRKLHGDSVARFANVEFAGLEPILRRYLDSKGLSAVEGACVAAAGPVRDGVAEMTNLSWTIDAAQLIRASGARQVAILNDLQAQGHALDHIDTRFLRPVIAGPAAEGMAKLVIGVGTGMNAAPVHETPWGRVVAASECGHVSMPVRDARDFRLAQFVESHGPHAHGFAGVEDVLAGRGLERIYAFVCEEVGMPQSLNAAEIMAELADERPRAVECAELYVHILGSVTGNLALTHLPFGGIYLIGGVARAMMPYLDRFGFSRSFRDKGRFSEFMENFAVTMVEDDYAALTGCAAYLANGGKG